MEKLEQLPVIELDRISVPALLQAVAQCHEVHLGASGLVSPDTPEVFQALNLARTGEDAVAADFAVPGLALTPEAPREVSGTVAEVVARTVAQYATSSSTTDTTYTTVGEVTVVLNTTAPSAVTTTR